MMDPGDVIHPDELKKITGKQVDLVIYKGGERIVVGKASIQSDGKIEAQVARDVREDVKRIISAGVGDVSINPERPVPRKTTFVASASKLEEKKDGQA